MKSTTKSLTIYEVAALLGKPKEYVYGVVQAGVVDFGSYYKKEGKSRGTYFFPPGRLASYLGITIEELFRELEEIKGEVA